LLNWLALLNNDPSPPLVHSVSYGLQTEHATSGSYKDRFETEMKKLGSRGITVIFASGDDGAGCSNCQRLEPSFPATTPSVTSVGATTFLSGPPVTPETQEEAVTAFGSGGGFSWYYPVQDWQKDACDTFIKDHTGSISSQWQWNKQGRGTPDVAALGWDFQVVMNGQVTSVGGTSAAAPTFAAIVSLLNDQQLKAGKPSLGFLNPWIYQTAAAHSDAFFDVTVGQNANSCCAGFTCSSGWDAVTGNGTPNYERLKAYLP
jgi:tripeptidyl-peptidase-1